MIQGDEVERAVGGQEPHGHSVGDALGAAGHVLLAAGGVPQVAAHVDHFARDGLGHALVSLGVDLGQRGPGKDRESDQRDRGNDSLHGEISSWNDAPWGGVVAHRPRMRRARAPRNPGGQR